MTLRQRLETAGIAFGLMWSILYPLMTPFVPVDLVIFLDAGSGRDLTDFFYAPWSLPFFAVLDLLPFKLAAVIAYLISFGGFVFALHVFKGNRFLFFISYPFLMLTYYGQLDGIYALGLAGMVIGLRQRSTTGDILTALCWIVAITKFYVGIPLGLGVLFCFASDLRSAIRISVLVAIFGVLSLVMWPGWLGDLLARSAQSPPNTAYSIDLWRYIGFPILLLWVPFFWSRRRDFIWWTATWALTVPYLYPWSLVFLIMLPVGWIGWGVQTSYLTGFVLSTFLQVIPFTLYVQRLWKWWKQLPPPPTT